MQGHEQAQREGLDLVDYLRVARRRWWIIALTTLAVVGAALAVTFSQTPMYRSSVSFVVGTLIDPTGTTSSSDALIGQIFGQQQLATQTAAIESVPVAQRVVDQLGLDARPEQLLEQVNAELTTEQVLVVSAESEDPAFAAELATTFVSAYLDARNDEALDSVLRAAESLRRRQDVAQDRLAQIEAEIRASGRVPRLGQDDGSGGGLGGPTALERERERLQTEIEQLDSRLADLNSTQAAVNAGGQVIRPAQVPDEPFAPQPIRNTGLALVLGLTLGTALAFFRDYLDDAIRSEDQAKRATGRPVVGHLPRWRGAADGETRLVSVVEPSSPEAEAYRTLRTNLRFLASAHSSGSILLTSAIAGDGKTTTAGNLAVAMARGNARVLLVGADLRKPAIHKSFGIEISPGLSEILIGDVEVSDAVVDVGIPNLRVIPSGRIPPNPAELLGSPAMLQLMSTLEQIADYVIYDGPPVLAVADALELSPRVGMTVLVVDAGNTGRHALSQAASRLAAVGAELGGVVLNRASGQDGYYGYSYYASYTEEEKPAKGRRWRKRSAAPATGEIPSTGFTSRRPPTPVLKDDDADSVWGDAPAAGPGHMSTADERRDEPESVVVPRMSDDRPGPSPAAAGTPSEPVYTPVSDSEGAATDEPGPMWHPSPADPIDTGRGDLGGDADSDRPTAPSRPPWEYAEPDLDDSPSTYRG